MTLATPSKVGDEAQRDQQEPWTAEDVEVDIIPKKYN